MGAAPGAARRCGSPCASRGGMRRASRCFRNRDLQTGLRAAACALHLSSAGDAAPRHEALGLPWGLFGGSGGSGERGVAGGGLGRQPGGTAALRRLVLRLSRGARGPALSPERPELTRLPSEMPGRPAARGGTAGARTPGNAGRPPGVSQPRTFTSFVLWVHGQRSNQPVPLSNCPPSPPRGGRSLGGPEGSASFVSCR